MKKLELTPISLKADGGILIDSINANDIDWQLLKTVEECGELIDAIMKHRNGKNLSAHVAAEVGDVFLQVGIMQHIYSAPVIQKFINQKLLKVDSKNSRLGIKKNRFNNIGFKNE